MTARFGTVLRSLWPPAVFGAGILGLAMAAMVAAIDRALTRSRPAEATS